MAETVADAETVAEAPATELEASKTMEENLEDAEENDEESYEDEEDANLDETEDSEEDKEEEFEEEEEATAARILTRRKLAFKCRRYRVCMRAKCLRARLCGRRPGYCIPFVNCICNKRQCKIKYRKHCITTAPRLCINLMRCMRKRCPRGRSLRARLCRCNKQKCIWMYRAKCRKFPRRLYDLDLVQDADTAAIEQYCGAATDAKDEA